MDGWEGGNRTHMTRLTVGHTTVVLPPNEMVPGRGIEPRSLGLQPSALPLSEPDVTCAGEWFSRQDSNLDDEIQSLASDHWTTGEEMVHQPGFEPGTS